MKLKIFSSIVIFIVVLFIGYFLNNYSVNGTNCKNEKGRIVLYKEMYYEYNFPIKFIPFCGEIKTWKKDKLYVSQFKNGLKNGVRKIYYKNGKLFLRVTFMNNLREGELIGWARNGQKIASINLKNGLKDGHINQWYPNGLKRLSGYYQKGKKFGEFIVWDKQGNISSKKYINEIGDKNGN